MLYYCYNKILTFKNLFIINIFIAAVYCDVTVPEMPENSTEVTHDATEKAGNDKDWNSFTRTVKYKCPEGSVLEFPEKVKRSKN